MKTDFRTILLLAFAVPAFANEPKLKLGDLPDPQDKQRSMDEDPHPKEVMEEKFQGDLHKNIAEVFYMKGRQALEAGNLDIAEGYFDRALILVPDHEGARKSLAEVLKSYDPPAASTVSLAPSVLPTPSPSSTAPLRKAKGKKENPDESKNLAEKIYIAALTAVQSGQKDQAIALCQQALALDPEHQPAQRMLKRLIPNPNEPAQTSPSESRP
jgi:tetratricopeptide (TPR) repeat protein